MAGEPQERSEALTEGEGATLGEAKWAAIKALERRYPGVGADDVRFDVLDEGMNRPLTLVSAPPGAGKTALLASWLAERPRERTGWISIRPNRG